MLLLGLVLMIVAAAVTAGAIYDGGEHATFEVFGQTVGTTVAGIFMLGLATMLVFFIGVWMAFSSAGRARRRRLERKEARNRQKQSVSQMEQERAELRAENERLSSQLASNRSGTTTATGTGAAGADGTTDRTDPAERPQHVNGDRVVDHTTDLSGSADSADRTGTSSTDLRGSETTAASTSGRHRDL